MFLFLVLTAASAVSPVQKVIELLDELKGKVQADVEAEGKLMNEYVAYCDSESNAKEDAITSAKRTINDLQATIVDNTATMQTLTAETEELAAKIRAGDQDLEAATDVRKSERADFEAKETELTETVDTLERAVIVLKRGQTFLQKDKGKDAAMQALAMGLSRIVEASWVTSGDKAAVQAMLQSEDEDLSDQPQATTAAYESKGGNIIEILQDMQTKAEEALSAARKAEMESQHQYDMLKQDLTTSSKTLTKRLTEGKISRSAAEETAGTAKADLGTTEDTLKTDKTTLAQLTQTCSDKQAEWGRRQKSVSEEVGAIDKAKEILAGGVKSFFMSGVKTVRRHVSDLADSRRAQATELLRKLAGRPHLRSFALTQVLQSAESDPFGKVRGLIEGLLERLMKEAGEEADAKAFCDTEMAKSKAKQADLTAAVDRHTVRIEQAVAGEAKLTEQVKHLEAEVGEIDTSTAEATRIRGEEHEEYLRASAEYKQSAEAVANAMSVLQEYYAQASFLQAKVLVNQAPEFGGAKTDIASTILEMLEVAEADFTKLLAEAEAEESSALSAFDALAQDSKVSKAAKQSQAKGKKGEIKSLQLNLLNYKEDHASTSKELDATLAYLDKLKPQCETKVMSYAERMQRREEEIAGLKEALAILEG